MTLTLGVKIDRFNAGEVPMAAGRALVNTERNTHIFEHTDVGCIECRLFGFEETLPLAYRVEAIYFTFSNFFTSTGHVLIIRIHEKSGV